MFGGDAEIEIRRAWAAGGVFVYDAGKQEVECADLAALGRGCDILYVYYAGSEEKQAACNSPAATPVIVVGGLYGTEAYVSWETAHKQLQFR